MASNIKPLIALGLTAAGTALVANFQVSEPIPVMAAVPVGTTSSTGQTTRTSSTSTTTASSSSTSGSSAAATSAPSTAAPDTNSTVAANSSSSGMYADGSYTGSAIREPWGTFEIQVTVSSGEITAVKLVAAPNDRHSSSINSYAVPQLTQEVLATQTSDIDWVSGATWTSQSYTTSLQSALDVAAAKAQTAG